MKLNSLIDNIRDSIVTGLGKKVSVSDRSLLNVLISDPYIDSTPEDTEGATGKSFRSRARALAKYCLTPLKSDKFPLSRLALRLVLLLTFLPLLLIYVLIWLMELLFGRKITLRSVMRSPRANMLISLSIIVVAVTGLVSMIVFFVNDVMLYSPQRDINSKGALTITQPCQREHSIFMFSSASLWADTGIDLIEGDVVTISGSGSFESSIWDKKAKAEKNEKPQYSLINIAYEQRGTEREPGAVTKYCIYNESSDSIDNPPRFGSLLYQIRPSQRQCVNANTASFSPICQARVDGAMGVLDERFTVRNPGTLYVCVNDIYLTDSIVESMFSLEDDSVWSIKPEATGTLELYAKKDMTNRSVSELRDNLLALAGTPDGRANWLYDNCGDILLSIRVERNIWSGTTLGAVDKAYSYVFRSMENIISPDRNGLYAFLIFGLCILAWLIFDRSVGVAMRYKSKDNSRNNQ